MRVNVSYTSEFDQIPDEVSEMLGLQARKLKILSTELQEARTLHLEKGNHHACLEHVHALRVRMAALDMRLDDCVSILTEWNKAKITMSGNKQDTQEIDNPNEIQEGEENV